MSYYNVLILTRKGISGHDYQSESVYFGENERLMQVGFYQAVRKAQRMPDAEADRQGENRALDFSPFFR